MSPALSAALQTMMEAPGATPVIVPRVPSPATVPAVCIGGIDLDNLPAVLAAGARNVSVAEPNPHGSEIGSLQLHTPWALPAFVGIAAAEVLDPMVPIVAAGDTTFHDVAGVEIPLSAGIDRKTIYGKVIDCAGNESEVAAAVAYVMPATTACVTATPWRRNGA